MNKNELYEKIKNNLNFSKHSFSEYDYIKLGTIQGMKNCFDNNIGYCLQIREQDDNSAAIFLIRHANGNIMAHENQDFYHIKKDLIPQIKQHFKISPEDEKEVKKLGYIFNGIEKKGFLIKNKKSITKNINNF